MSEPPYDRLKALFLEARDLSGEARRSFVDDACGEDAELRDALDRLLDAHERGGGMFGSAGQDGGERSGDSVGEMQQSETATQDDIVVPPASGRPWRVGPYRIAREIGRGGMGVVYLGYREGDRVKRRVAIKVLKRGLDTEEILRRFEQERQVLAAFNHVGIARLYDAGETADGIPYFAMEYVEGQPIDQYADSHRLRIAERLELFRKVCDAVQYVHQNLMVHRDLKPSNILVTGKGVPKLLDFGIAKLTNPEMSLFGVDLTTIDRKVMTPAYASPEQVRGDPITVASDIYALGVILYELLAGHHPYQVTSLVRGEIERVICETDPERPSTAATRSEVIALDGGKPGMTTSITPEVVAKVREGRPDRLRRRLAGDLDNIVLMAMRKEPQRRYESAHHLGEDIRRHLVGLTVTARRDTAPYRLTKFVRRHRRGIAAAVVVLIALAGWGVTAALGWSAETRHSRMLSEESARTRRMLDAVLDLANVFIFDLHDEVVRLDGSLPVQKLVLETAQDCLEDLRRDVGDDPRLLKQLAAAYDRVGELWGGHRGATFGNTSNALENFRIALAMREALLADDPGSPELREDVALSHLNIGDVLRFTGDIEGATTAYHAQLDVMEALAREDFGYRRQYAIALATVASVCKDMGRLGEAKRLYDESLDVRQRLLDEQPGDGLAIRDLGVGYVHSGEARALMGDYESALELYLRSIERREQLSRADPDHTRMRRYLALSHYFAADMLLKLDRPDEAALHVEAAFSIVQERMLKNPTDASARLNMAMAWEIRGRLDAALGRPDTAMDRYGRWREIAAELSQIDAENTIYRQYLAQSQERIGDLHHRAGDTAAGIRSYREALDLIDPIARADSEDMDLQIELARVHSGLGELLTGAGDLPGALAQLETARSIQSAMLAKSPRHARAREGLTLTLRRLSRLAGQRGYLEEAVDHAKEAQRVAISPDAAVLRDLAAALAMTSEVEQAITMVQEALDLLADANGPAGRALRDALRKDLASYQASR